MASAKQHYDQLLGSHYTWSVAAAGDPYDRAADWLKRNGLAGFTRYLDLGAGFGAHSVPLARAGKSVTAVDFHPGLLAELRAAAPTVNTHESELVAFLETAGARWDAVLCLGDTLTQLPDRATAARFLAVSARALAPGGVLALGYRDYSGAPRAGVDRFIPVRHDKERAMLCCVEVIDADRVSVTDIVTTVESAGLRTQIGAYAKLRLMPSGVAACLAAIGLALDREATEDGMLLQVFRAPG